MLQYDTSHIILMLMSEVGGTSVIIFHYAGVDTAYVLLLKYWVCRVSDAHPGKSRTPLSKRKPG